ncbi:MarR family transcriptional regulator [Luteococcus japonicus]|uniref:Transcriptional regulator, MarR family n=2 Tax=Luteococcus japonicus TaxID=33984 RepID=A0A1R4KN38_9ACTN|nr:MarR family transcriptional regulator [Luteococcus japonicus]ROR53652.1 MarR family transcriptional regulator [Luteococcus japonicus]SJN45806.1 Transcriptional regulator, MarR family [Luteococcus japonicus LSP_Lj1]
MVNPDESLWLSAEQQRIWRSWLLAVARVDNYLDQDLCRHGLDLAEYEILVVLAEAENRRLRMSELAELVHQSRSRLTHAVARMEKSGWVERCSAPEDRRGVVAVLTDKGYHLLEQAAPNHVAAVRRILVDAADPEDFKALGRVMQAVLAVQD